MDEHIENKSESINLHHAGFETNVPQEGKIETFNGVAINELTKRQMKKYQKFQKWQKVKKEKRSKEKEKMKEKRRFAKLNNIKLGPSRKELKKNKLEKSSCQISVCIDLSFDDLMIDKVGK